ncbi:MAG TPA: cysteine desulfurase DndA [Archangium sp.]|uniref:cysteine desulfurase DndA n=1 Tax=Archangium sp. TaxID=1872627 RepID=UPI002E34A15E|nr:cysteine desulfurase DndA [Archangium sp.]HEX5747157.1 cysteine desulfurase DndA [Archangium sp.]
MTAYLDCNATTPMEPEVRDVVLRFMAEDFGNAGSRTHDFGIRAQQAVQRAREQVAAVLGAKRDEVLFTSGATESNNLAILGLAPHGEKTGRRHIVSTAIEHKAVLEPLERLRKCGFEVTLVPPTGGGWVDADAIRSALRPDTLLVSVMHVNNETGVLQPLDEICRVLTDHPAYLHTDAAQGFGKEFKAIRNPRIDLISISGHKIYGPKGVGALLMRRRDYERVPLTPLMVGGGQERGLRPGTVAVPLVVGLGLAAEIALCDNERRQRMILKMREEALASLKPLNVTIHGDTERTLPHVLNISFPGVDSEAVMLAWKGISAVSNGAACTSQSYTLSHVLLAMGFADADVRRAVRISWCHLTGRVDWAGMAAAIVRLI